MRNRRREKAAGLPIANAPIANAPRANEPDGGALAAVDGSFNGVDLLRAQEIQELRECGQIDGDPEIDVTLYADIINAYRDKYDYIVVDTPALMANTETNIIAGSADYVFLLAEWCVTTREALRVGAQRLLDAQAQIIGFVITKVDEKQRIYFQPEDRHFYFKKR